MPRIINDRVGTTTVAGCRAPKLIILIITIHSASMNYRSSW